jgi:hypothetical protein
MLEASGDQRFALETDDLLAGRIEQLLERDRSPESAILGGNDSPHATARDLAIDSIERRRNVWQGR